MNNTLDDNSVFGLLKTNLDVHTLGVTTVAQLLENSRYKVIIASEEVAACLDDLDNRENSALLSNWIREHSITHLGFSYRLDPDDANEYFQNLTCYLEKSGCLTKQGGSVKKLYFAGLPHSCELIRREKNGDILVFPGDETPAETLELLQVPKERWPASLPVEDEYDRFRHNLARNLVKSESYKSQRPLPHNEYAAFGQPEDSLVQRIRHCKKKGTLPILRAHVGPYNKNHKEAIREFHQWINSLKAAEFLDVLSIGTSQLSQARFGEDWQDQPDGGGVPINSEDEFRAIRETASPMLVRTYAGTKNIVKMAGIYENSLNIAWHALSFWWFCEIDGRGENSVLNNLREHFNAIQYIASTSKPLEPNIPHHFAFRGGDDITYVLSAYLAAKAAKKLGIRHLVLQNMLNTPKHTPGLRDIIKGRVLLKLARSLEDERFQVFLQTRAGLDYFSPDQEKAKIQLAEVTAMMDDLEPDNENSPEIIHVVSYSEASCLASPDIINESIQITLNTLQKYRTLKKSGAALPLAHNQKIISQCDELYQEAKEAIDILEAYIPDLYTPEGFYQIFKEGFFPVPYLFNNREKYPEATCWNTMLTNKGVQVVDDAGNIIPTAERYRMIINKSKPPHLKTNQ